MKVLVTGVKGQLGFDVVNELEKRGHTAIGVDVEFNRYVRLSMVLINWQNYQSVVEWNSFQNKESFNVRGE